MLIHGLEVTNLDECKFYGACGQFSCIYYNLYVAESVTLQGRSAISAAALLFEMFLANNVKFRSLNEVVTFIHNVISEERHYDDRMILDRDITLEESFFQVMNTCGFSYIPTEEDMEAVWDIMKNLRQEDLNRLYYKNNLYAFMDNKSMTNAIIYMLQLLDLPFMDPNEAPKEIEVELDEFWELIKEYVYYGHQIIDRIERLDTMYRSIAIIIDTDSSIVSLDAWYRYILDKVVEVPMRLKTQLINPIDMVEADEFGDRELLKVVDIVPPSYEYDFYSDEKVELDRMINPVLVTPQDSLRYSIINIIAYCLSKMVNDYMKKYTINSNSYSPDRPACLLNMKNEFLFKRAMLSSGKKNYASIQELQEGNYLGAKLDVKGLPLTKSNAAEITQKRLKEILYEDMLKVDKIDQVHILKRLAIFENDIYNSLLRGDKDFYKPLRIKSISSYDDPFRIQGVKASYVWNKLRTSDLEAIDLDKRNSIDIVKLKITEKDADRIKASDPEVYEKIIDLMKEKAFVGGIDVIAIPKNVKTPDWVMEFIDYTSIIHDNLNMFPLEPIGIYRMNNNNNMTNILKL